MTRKNIIADNTAQWELGRENPDIVGARCNVPLQKALCYQADRREVRLMAYDPEKHHRRQYGAMEIGPGKPGHRRGTLQRAPTVEQFGKPTSNTVPTIVRLFKSASTKRINEMHHTPGVPVWQRNYYEHIIRNDDELNHIREYIAGNTAQWELDRENPDIVGARCNVPLQKDEP